MIPFVDLKEENGKISQEINEKIRQVIENTYFILDNEVKKFEEKFSQYIGTRFGISVNSGSDALFLAVKSLGIGRQDEVITVSHTFISTVNAISRNGAKPVFIDIEPETYCINTDLIEEKISDKTKAIIPVHIYGHPADMDPIMDIANDYDLFVIEDACQAHGAEYKGQKVGSIGDIGCFSFYPTKNMGAYGDGGIAVTDNEEIAGKMMLLRNYGQSEKYYQDYVGINSRLDEIQAAILQVKLKYLNEWNEKRRNIAKVYNDNLEDIKLFKPVAKEYSKPVYHLYVLRYMERDLLRNYLDKEKIQTQIHYPVPVHKQNSYLEFNMKKLPVTEKICGEIISLPMHPWIKQEEILEITDVIKNAIS